jgi:hypothetical protein
LAQKVELSPVFGRQFGGEIDAGDGILEIPAAWSYGLMLDIAWQPGVKLELLYTRQETRLDLKPFSGDPTSTLFDMAVQYIQAGVLYELHDEAKTRPFFGLTVGASYFDAREAEREGKWSFAGGFGGGVKHFLTGNVGLRADGRILFSLTSTGDEIFCTPTTCVTGVDSAIIAQGLLSGGLLFAF